MTVATLRMDLLLDDGQSSWERRRRMRAIMEKLHRHFNVSVAESDHPEEASRVVLIVAAAARTRREARERLERVADAVAAHPRAALLSRIVTEV